MQTGGATVENSMEAPQNVKKNRTTIQPNEHTGYLPKKNSTKILNQRDTCTPMFIVALFKIAKLWK